MPSEELTETPTEPVDDYGDQDNDLEHDDDPQDIETLIAQRDMWQDRARTAEAQLKRKEPTPGKSTRDEVVPQAAARFQAELDRSAAGLGEAFANIDAMFAADEAAHAARMQRRHDQVALYVHTWFARNWASTGPGRLAAADFANEIMAIVRSYDGPDGKDERS